MHPINRNLASSLALMVILSATQLATAFYDPGLGRWLNRDPLEEKGGINLYQFSRCAPVSFYDTDGRATSGIGTPGIGWVFAEEAASEVAKEAARRAALAALAAVAAVNTSFCPKPNDPCERWNALRNYIKQYHGDVLRDVSNVIKASGPQRDLDKVSGLTPELRAMIGAMYQAAADCFRGKKDVSFNDDRAKFLRGESSNGPGSNSP